MITTQVAARAYTLAEVDAMRAAVQSLIKFTAVRTSFGERTHILVEDRVRTYMMAGVDPAELQAEAESQHARFTEGNSHKLAPGVTE